MSDLKRGRVASPESRPGTTTPARVPRKGLLLALLSSVQFVLVAGMTIVVVSLPAIRDDLGFSTGRLSWVITMYGLTFGGFLLLGGRLADILGRQRLFLIGVTAFTAASVLNAVAWSDTVLVVGRGLQGLSAALAAPAAMSLITSTFTEPRERHLALGVWAAVGASGATLGNVVGGVLTSTVGWRWIFLFNVPVGVVAVFGGLVLLPKVAMSARFRVDLFGATTVTVALALLIFGLGRAPEVGFGAAPVVGVFIASAVLLVLFVISQLKFRHALVPLRLFRHRGAFAFVLILLAGIANMGPYYFSSIVMQDHLGYSAVETGLAFVPWAGLTVVVTQVISGFVDKIGPRYLIPASLLVAAAGITWLLLGLGPEMTYVADILGPFVLLGVGAGGLMVAGMITAMTSLPNHAQGLAAGLTNACQQLGSAISIAVLVSLAAAYTKGQLELGRDHVASTLAGVQAGLWVSVGVTLAASAIALVVLPRRLSRHES